MLGSFIDNGAFDSWCIRCFFLAAGPSPCISLLTQCRLVWLEAIMAANKGSVYVYEYRNVTVARRARRRKKKNYWDSL